MYMYTCSIIIIKYILSHRYREILQVGYSVATSPKHAVSNE